MGMERIVALDVGDKRIGIAVSDPLGFTAQPIETYTRVGYGPDVRHIAAICERYGTTHILSGLPRNMDGTEGFQAEKVRAFAEKLTEAGFQMEFSDERMTTIVAESALLQADMRREDRKKKVDMVAAVVILQSYLNALAMKNGGEEADDEAADAEDDVLEMEDEDGNVIRFRLTASVLLDGETYAILSPLEDSPDFDADESFVMHQTQDDDDESCYEPVEDEALLSQVYRIYLQESGAE